MHFASFPASIILRPTGTKIAARMAMIATTIKISGSVKAACLARSPDFRTTLVVRAFPLSVKCAIILGSMVITVL
jgi:hypothetical protein